MICKKEFKRISTTHLKYGHNMTYDDYYDKFPNAETESSEIKKQRVNTLDNMIRKYGEVEGKVKWDNYRKKQAESNTFEYKQKKYGWTKEQFDEYNKSRGVSGNRNGNYGSSYYQIWVEKYGKEIADDMNRNVSKLKVRNGVDNGNYQRPKRPEELEKMRKSAIKRVKRQYGNMISYNPQSIPIIEQYGKENGYNFQHAENGGEIEVCGYLVDGYDKDKNVVIEYYEKHHNRKIQKDLERQLAIMNELKCKFIIIKYDSTIEEYNFEN